MKSNSKDTGSSVVRWYDEAPQREGAGFRDSIARGTNFVVVLTRAEAGARLARTAQVDEYMVLLIDAAATIRAGGMTIEAGPESVTIVPPGDSDILMHGAGQVFRLFSHLAEDLAGLASNRDDFARRDPAVSPLVPWPAPADGLRLRTYRLADATRADSNMRIYRSTNLMLNVMKPRMVARDTTKLSPHSHADFEQGSLALQGRWVHHMRYSWGPDMSDWRDDEHVEVDSPSMAVIAPQAVHTSRNVNDGGAWLLDIFAPPRLDFSSRPGQVANEQDYPLPAVEAGTGSE
jgi:mannose-6-phosphate isomerase-like protein (cupin superfamily)